MSNTITAVVAYPARPGRAGVVFATDHTTYRLTGERRRVAQDGATYTEVERCARRPEGLSAPEVATFWVQEGELATASLGRGWLGRIHLLEGTHLVAAGELRTSPVVNLYLV